MTTKEAITHLVEALKSDEAYRYSWQANIAVQFQDEWMRYVHSVGRIPKSPEEIHHISNEAADEFLTLLCQPTEAPVSGETPSTPPNPSTPTQSAAAS